MLYYIMDLQLLYPDRRMDTYDKSILFLSTIYSNFPIKWIYDPLYRSVMGFMSLSDMEAALNNSIYIALSNGNWLNTNETVAVDGKYTCRIVCRMWLYWSIDVPYSLWMML